MNHDKNMMDGLKASLRDVVLDALESLMWPNSKVELLYWLARFAGEERRIIENGVADGEEAQHEGR